MPAGAAAGAAAGGGAKAEKDGPPAPVATAVRHAATVVRASALPAWAAATLAASPLPRGAPQCCAVCGAKGAAAAAAPGEGGGGGADAGAVAGPCRACGQCRLVYVCGAACQRADWRQRHKKECAPLKYAAQLARGETGPGGYVRRLEPPKKKPEGADAAADGGEEKKAAAAKKPVLEVLKECAEVELELDFDKLGFGGGDWSPVLAPLLSAMRVGNGEDDDDDSDDDEDKPVPVRVTMKEPPAGGEKKDEGDEEDKAAAADTEPRPRVTTFSLRSVRLGADGAVAVAGALTPATKTLQLWSCALTPGALGPMSEALLAVPAAEAVTRNLTTLQLGWNRLGGGGLRTLLGALGGDRAPVLSTLEVPCSGLDDAAAADLAHAVTNQLPALRTLILDGNPLGDVAAAALALALADRSIGEPLDVLSLDSCKIGSVGVEAFATALAPEALEAIKAADAAAAAAKKGGQEAQQQEEGDASAAESGAAAAAAATDASAADDDAKVVDSDKKEEDDSSAAAAAAVAPAAAAPAADAVAPPAYAPRVLRLNGCDLEDGAAGAGALLSAIRVLGLNACELDNTALAGSIAAGVSHASCVCTELDLSACDLEDEGAELLAAALESNTSIASLDLSDNEMTGDMWKTLRLLATRRGIKLNLDDDEP